MTVLPKDQKLKLVLGSGSPRRLELLAQLGVTVSDVRPPDIDETPHHAERPRAYVNRIAAEKAAAVTHLEGEVVLCADTSVAIGRRILGKPADKGEAEQFLQTLSGRRHKVFHAIMGLPLPETAGLLVAAGYPLFGEKT